MHYSIIIYLSSILMIISGGILIFNTKRKIVLWKIKRWHINIDYHSFTDIPPFSMVISIMDKRQKERINVEIYEAISFLRNTSAVGLGSITSSDTIIEQLAANKGILSPVYAQMLRLLRQNLKDEAIQYFASKVDTDIGKDFGRLLIQWEEIDPKNLMETLLSHQKSIKEIRNTVQKRKDEIISDLIYLPVVINVMLVFLNFIYVGYFLDQREMLNIFLN